MEVGNYHRVDRLRLDAGGGEVGNQCARGRRELPAGASVEKHQLAAGIDEQRRKRHRQSVGRHEGVGQGLLDFGVGNVAHEPGVDRSVPKAVVNRGELEAPELEAIEAGRLLSADRHGRIRSRRLLQGLRRNCERATSEQGATREAWHDNYFPRESRTRIRIQCGLDRERQARGSPEPPCRSTALLLWPTDAQAFQGQRSWRAHLPGGTWRWNAPW